METETENRISTEPFQNGFYTINSYTSPFSGLYTIKTDFRCLFHNHQGPGDWQEAIQPYLQFRPAGQTHLAQIIEVDATELLHDSYLQRSLVIVTSRSSYVCPGGLAMAIVHPEAEHNRVDLSLALNPRYRNRYEQFSNSYDAEMWLSKTGPSSNRNY